MEILLHILTILSILATRDKAAQDILYKLMRHGVRAQATQLRNRHNHSSMQMEATIIIQSKTMRGLTATPCTNLNHRTFTVAQRSSTMILTRTQQKQQPSKL